MTASTDAAAIADVPHGDCTVDACVALGQGAGSISLLATLSNNRIGQPFHGPACAAADIVVSDRGLPEWCPPCWLQLDRAALAATGAVAIWIVSRRLQTAGELTGERRWMPQPHVRRPRVRRAPV